MTKPCNFPERINERRRRAAERIHAQLTLGMKMNHGKAFELTVEDILRLNREGDALGLRLRPSHIARGVRTKKTKALGWSTGRAAYRSGKISA